MERTWYSSAYSAAAIPYGHRVSQHAASSPEHVAIVFVGAEGVVRTVTYRELDRSSTSVARLLAGRRVRAGSIVALALQNSVEHYQATLAAWKLGALVVPLNPQLPDAEREQLLALLPRAVVVADWSDLDERVVVSSDDVRRAAARLSADALPVVIAKPGKACTSGGSTGRPKIIVDPGPWAALPGDVWDGVPYRVGLRAGQTQLVAGSLYFNAPFSWSHFGLFEGHRIVLLEHFDPERVLDAIESYSANFVFAVPTMLLRLERAASIDRRDLSSIESILHAGASCPQWLKRAWIRRLGGRRIWEAYGASEAIGMTIIGGDEWLARPGSVGRPYKTKLRILGEAGGSVPAGAVGEIFSRPAYGSAFEYIGSPPLPEVDGFASVGDLGWLDDAGYLYVADRRVDLIISGGANVYPAEVEAALVEHPRVADAVVIGLPDAEWGRRVHAIVEPVHGGAAPPFAELNRHCRHRLALHKVPKTWEYMTRLPRDENLKIRRGALVAERAAGARESELR